MRTRTQLVSLVDFLHTGAFEKLQTREWKLFKHGLVGGGQIAPNRFYRSSPEQNPQLFEHLPFILLPPLFLDMATKITDFSPSNVFIGFSKCIESFISDNKDIKKLNFIYKVYYDTSK